MNREIKKITNQVSLRKLSNEMHLLETFGSAADIDKYIGILLELAQNSEDDLVRLRAVTALLDRCLPPKRDGSSMVNVLSVAGGGSGLRPAAVAFSLEEGNDNNGRGTGEDDENEGNYYDALPALAAGGGREATERDSGGGETVH